MNVARLKAWLLRLLAPLVDAWHRHLGTSSQASATRADRMLVAAASASPYRSGLASGSWLEDARRLRPRPVSRLGSAAPSRENVQRILHDPHWAAAYNAAQTEHFPRSAPAPEPRDPRETERQVRRSEQASRPLASSAHPDERESASLSSLRERRRLVYVRELVRRGIYNEGFNPGTMPEQYRPHPERDPGTGSLPPDE